MMEDRRMFLGMAAAAALLPLNLDAQAAGTVLPRTSDRGPSARTGETRADGTTRRVRSRARGTRLSGRPTGRGPRAGLGHRHSGFVVGYVLEGQLRFAINNEPERIIPAGGTFFEAHWRPSLDQRRRARRADALSRVPGGPQWRPGGGAGLTEADLKVRLYAHGTARTATHPARA